MHWAALKEKVMFVFGNHKIRKGKAFRLAVVTVCAAAVFCSLAISALAAVESQVTVTVGATDYSDTQFIVDVTVSYADMSLYNENVYLSYHIYGKNGELLVFENERMPMENLGDGQFWRTVCIDVTSIPELEGVEAADILFDLVDEKNVYWFSQNSGITFQSNLLEYDASKLLSTAPQSPGNEDPQPTSGLNVASQILVVAANVLGWIAVVVIALHFRKKKINGGGGVISGKDNNNGAMASIDALPATRPVERLEFISWLRAAACVFVILSHFFGIYLGGVQGVFMQILPGKHTATRLISAIMTSIEATHINLGTTGVGIFFLITGFVTTMSLQRDNRAVFLLKRLIRIWPVYIAGTAVLYLTSRLYTTWAGTAMPAGLRGFLIQASLIRDFLWESTVDGIGWTLEVQVKIYVVLFLLSKLKLLDKWKVMAGLSLIGAFLVAAVQSYMETWLYASIQLYRIGYVLSTSAVYVIFSFVGVTFCNLFTGKWDIRESAAAMAVCVYAFYLSSLRTSPLLTAYYFAAIAIFAVAFVIRNKIRMNRVTAFISKISFSLYIVHGVNGYYLLSFLDHMGVGFYPAVIIVTALAVGLAYILYVAVERPCVKLTKKINKRSSPEN